MPKQKKNTGGSFPKERTLTTFRRNDPKTKSVVHEEYLFKDINKKSGDEDYPWNWKCSTSTCKAHLHVTGDFEGEYMRGYVVSETHMGGKGRGHPKPKLASAQPKPAAEPEEGAEDVQDIAADMTALALEEPQPDEPQPDEPGTSRAALPAVPAEPTMRALTGKDKAAAVALASVALPDLPQHMRDPVIESATRDQSSDFAQGFFGARGELLGFLIGWKNHWNGLKQYMSLPTAEKELAKANRWRTAYIALLAVDATHRKQGIGRALVSAFVDDVQPADNVLPVPPPKPALLDKPPNIMYLHVRASNEGAVKFYKKLKFKEHKRIDVRYYGTEDGVIYVRRLERRSASESRVPKRTAGPSSKPGPKPKPPLVPQAFFVPATVLPDVPFIEDFLFSEPYSGFSLSGVHSSTESLAVFVL
ncbi:acetyltransferase (GNAT) family domain-containing protein [Ditylenchus destructor]|nr:acetyltransferase (GNAT) family domain-containing protein [Ditylenchus destructor]